MVIPSTVTYKDTYSVKFHKWKYFLNCKHLTSVMIQPLPPMGGCLLGLVQRLNECDDTELCPHPSGMPSGIAAV